MKRLVENCVMGQIQQKDIWEFTHRAETVPILAPYQGLMVSARM